MPGAAFLKGENINLRTIEEDDIEFMRDAVNNPRIWRNLSTIYKPINKPAQKEFFENSVCSEEETHLAICRDEEMKGIISLNPKEKGVAKIGLWIAEEFHGKGYGTEASKLVVEYAFNQLRYHKIFARVHEENNASKKIWEKLGFEKEGELRSQLYRDGSFLNIYMYGLLKEEWVS